MKQYLPDYMGLIFEKMCQDYLLYYSDNLLVELSEIGQWWGTDRKKKNIFLKGDFTDGLLQAQEHGEVRLVTLEDLYR